MSFDELPVWLAALAAVRLVLQTAGMLLGLRRRGRAESADRFTLSTLPQGSMLGGTRRDGSTWYLHVPNRSEPEWGRTDDDGGTGSADPAAGPRTQTG
jgi:hypothetical protein